MRFCGITPFLSALILCGLACGDRTVEPCDDTYDVGAVEGFVTIAGEGVATSIGVRPYDGPQQGRQILTFESAADGFYRVDLPNGLYRFYVPPSTATTVTTMKYRDSVQVESKIAQLNIPRTRFHVRLTFPEMMNGKRCRGCLDGAERFTMDEEIVDGKVDLIAPIIPPGDYQFYINLQTDKFWLPGSFDPSEAETFTLTASDSMLITKSFASYATISGTITGSWKVTDVGTPTVTAFCADSTLVGATSVNTSGEFLLELFEAQPIKLLVSIGGIDNWIGDETFESATLYNLQAEEQLTGITYIESGISCQIIARDPLNVSVVSVILIDENDREYRPDDFWHSEVAISNLRPGSYKMYIFGYCREQNWAPQWYDGADEGDEATLIDLGEGGHTQLMMELRSGGLIEGNVTRHNGRATNFARIILYSASGSLLCPYATYTNNGYFRISGLANSDFLVAVEDDLDELWWYPGTTAIDSATVISIDEYNTVSDIDWSLRRPPTR